MTTVKQIGVEIRNRRKLCGMAQKVLAEKAGISNSYLCDIESGRSNCSLSTLLSLAEALNVDCTELLKDPGES